MAQTVEELAQMLEDMQTAADMNAETVSRILTSINTHLEDIQNDTETDDLIKVYLNEYKKALEDRHAVISNEFTKISNALNNLTKKQDDLSKSTDIDKLFTTLLDNLQNIQNEFFEQRNSFSKFSTSFSNFTNDKKDKEEIISTINAVRQEREISDSHFEKNVAEITSNTESILKNLIVMDPTAQNDIIKRELENIYASATAVLTSIQETKQISDNIFSKFSEVATKQDITELQTSMNEFANVVDTLKSSLNTSNEDINILIKDKFEDFTEKIKDVVTAGDFTNFRHELADFIQQIVDNSSALNQNLSIQKDVLENLIDKISSFEISKNLDGLTFAMDQIKENSVSNREAITSEINSAATKINDNIDSKTNKLEDQFTKTANDIKSLQNDILVKLTDNTDPEKFQGLHNNIDMLRDTITSSQETRESELNEKISGITNVINEGLQSRNEKFSALQNCIDSFKAEINNFVTNFEKNSGNNISTINDIKSKIEDVAHVFTDWNYGQETRDSKIISMISSEIESLSNTVNELQASIQSEIHSGLSNNAEVLNQQTEKLIAYVEELKTQIANSNNDEKFDSIKNKIDNSSMLINDNINLLKDTITSTLNDNTLSEKLLAIRNIIVDKSDLNDENFRDLQEKIEEFINVGNRISSEAEIRMGNSVSELADLKTEIEDISSSFRNWDYNREEHDTKMVGMISAELDSLKDSVNTFQESVQTGIHQELARNSETVEKQLNNLIGYIDTLKEEIKTNDNNVNTEETSKDGLQDISDKINSIRQEINLINTDIMDTINTTADALMAEVSPLKNALDAIVEIKDSIKAEYEALNDTTRNEKLFSAIEDIKNFINEKMQISQQNNDEIKNIVNVAMNNDELKWTIDEFKNTVGTRISESSNSINEMLESLNQKIDILTTSESSELKYNIEEIKEMISSHKDLLDGSDVKESIIEAIVNVFDQISFIEESEDIKDFVEEKTDEINQNILEVKKQITQFVNGEDEYSYTLQDVESDIAKLRLVLNDLSNTSSQEEISDISNNIHRIVTTVEELQSSLTQEQISDLKNNFEKLSEDVVSISSRTNKLLLTSDESYNALNNGLNDFSNVISQLEERINYLDNKEITERIEEKLDNTYNVVASSANSDKVMRQALMYMGEWIDTTSENIESLCENTDLQNHKSEDIITALEEIKETLPEQKQLLSTITVHFDEQQERMDRLEMKLEKILAAIENIDDTKLVNKVDKIDKQVKKLSTTIEKLATYVDE